MTPLFLDHRQLCSTGLAEFRRHAHRSEGLVVAVKKRLSPEAYEPKATPEILQRVRRGTCGPAYAQALAAYEYEHMARLQGNSILPWLVADLLDAIERNLEMLPIEAATSLQKASGDAARRKLCDEFENIAHSVEQLGYLLLPTIDVHGQIGATGRSWRDDAIRRLEAVAKELRRHKITLSTFREKLPKFAVTETQRLQRYLSQVRDALAPKTADPIPVDDDLWQRAMDEILPR